MDRRRYLAATGVAVAGLAAGCVGNADSPDRGDDTDQGTPMMTYEARNDKTDDGRPLEHTVNVLYGGLRDERRPLRLELSVTNQSDERIAYGERRSALGLDARANGFILLGAGGQFYGFRDGWWTKTEVIARTEEYQVGTLEPGESTRVERVVVVNDINKNPDQLPDELRFELSYRAGSEADNRDWTDYEWGFRLVAVGGN